MPSRPSGDTRAQRKELNRRFADPTGLQFQAWRSCHRRAEKTNLKDAMAPVLVAIAPYMQTRNKIYRIARNTTGVNPALGRQVTSLLQPMRLARA